MVYFWLTISMMRGSIRLVMEKGPLDRSSGPLAKAG
jgi:hypothetical protein